MPRPRRILIVGVAAITAFAAGAVTSSALRDDPEPAATKAEPEVPRTPADAPVTVSSVPVADLEEVDPVDPELGTLDGSPLDDLPDHISVLTDFGQRPDWSPDGRHIVLLDGSPLGNVWIVNVETKDTRNLTAGLGEQLYSRAYYLSNGDLLLCGPTSGPDPSEAKPEAGRFTGVMSVLRAPFDDAPQMIGMPCWEGMAPSLSSMQIAWNRSDIDYTDSDLIDRVIYGITEVWTGEIRFLDDRPVIVGARKVLDRDTFGTLAVFEVQGFRPPTEDELILTAYAYQAGEVIGLDTKTGALRNYSNSTAYEEAEGVDPDGTTVYVERDLEYTGIDPGALDIWRLDLSDGAWERMTYFNRYEPYYASNPAVAPGGGQFAFQLSINGDTEGEGAGILIYDLRST